jgi:hypothetical protein
VHDDLVEKARLEALPGDVRAENGDITAASRLFRDVHGLLDADVEELPGDALDNRRLGGRIVAKHEERTAEGAAVEPWLQSVFNVLGPSADQQSARRAKDLVHRLARSAIHPEHPLHVVVRAGDEAVEAHHRVPEQLAHLRAFLHRVLDC